MWRRHNQCHQSEGGSQSGFPLLTLIMETYDGPAWRLMATPLSAPFQGFARPCGIQVFRLYSRPSPVTRSQCRSVMVRVSPSHPYNAGRARTRMRPSDRDTFVPRISWFKCVHICTTHFFSSLFLGGYWTFPTIKLRNNFEITGSLKITWKN